MKYDLAENNICSDDPKIIAKIWREVQKFFILHIH